MGSRFLRMRVASLRSAAAQLFQAAAANPREVFAGVSVVQVEDSCIKLRWTICRVVRLAAV